MCRIFVNPADVVYKTDDLLEFMTILEKRNGGDGNGVYSLSLGKGWKSMESINKKWLLDTPISNYGSFFFHTRMGTDGEKKTYNCQPLRGDRYIIVHNGIFTLHRRIAKYYGVFDKFSDSHTILRMIEEKGILKFYMGTLDESYGVVVVYDKQTEKIYVLKTSGSFEVGILDDGEYIYGSSNLSFWGAKTESLDDGLYIIDGNGYKQIHKPKPKIEYHGGRWTYNQNTGAYERYKKKKKKKKPEENTDTPIGLLELFPEENRRSWNGSGINTMSVDDVDDDWDSEIKYYDMIDTLVDECSYCAKTISCEHCLIKYQKDKLEELIDYSDDDPVKESPCFGDRCGYDCYNNAGVLQFNCELIAKFKNYIKVQRIKKALRGSELEYMLDESDKYSDPDYYK